jgi:hypothetical protein
MAYTTIDKPDLYFNTKLYTGNGGTNAITGVGFQPDFVWIKERSSTSSHNLVDAVRGATKRVSSDNTGAEDTLSGIVSSFDSDGFTNGADNGVNENSQTYASWNWKANGSGSSNGTGSITATVSANTTSGFSIVSYTGNGSNGATIAHGLGAAPKMVIIKKRSNTAQWAVGGTNIDSTFNGYLFLDSYAAIATSDNVFNDTAPSSSFVTLGTTGDSNASGQTYIAYCFADVKGYSKFGNYTGNGSTDGTFVYTGFKPGFVMIRNVNASGKWLMMDSKRPTAAPGNPNNARLFADQSTAESTASNMINLLSNGFKLTTSDSDHNASGDKNLYMAFAENPFVTSTAIPACAR